MILLIKLLKILWMRICKNHGHACSVETMGSDVAIFRNSILTLSVSYKKMPKEIFIVREFELHYKQLSWTVQKQPSTVIHFRKCFQEIPVVESFFW